MKNQEFVDTDVMPAERSRANGTSAAAKGGGLGSSQGRVEIDAQVELARQQMLELRRQQEELERLRQELEELRRREEEFNQGKAEMLEELSKTIALIEGDEFEYNKRLTLLANCRESYQDFTRQLNAINETEWKKDELKSELNKAFNVLEAARTELNKGRSQLPSLGDGPVKLSVDTATAAAVERLAPEPHEGFDFATEVKRGFARHLPLLLLGAIALVIWLARH